VQVGLGDKGQSERECRAKVNQRTDRQA